MHPLHRVVILIAELGPDLRVDVWVGLAGSLDVTTSQSVQALLRPVAESLDRPVTKGAARPQLDTVSSHGVETEEATRTAEATASAKVGSGSGQL
jgi:hypothetical protein